MEKYYRKLQAIENQIDEILITLLDDESNHASMLAVPELQSALRKIKMAKVYFPMPRPIVIKNEICSTCGYSKLSSVNHRYCKTEKKIK